MGSQDPRLALSRLTLEGAEVCHVRYAPGAEFDTHRHDQAVLSLIVEGDYLEWMGPTIKHLPCHFVQHYALGSVHAVRIGGLGARVVHLTDPAGTDWREELSPMALGLLWQLATEVRREEQFDDAARLHLQSLVYEVRGGDQVHATGWLQPVIGLIRDDPTRPWTLGELADFASVHPAHLARAFRVRLGMTVGELVRRLRVATAVDALRTPGAGLAWIALQAGFYDQSHMGKWFRRYLGATPQVVIRRHHCVRTASGSVEEPGSQPATEEA